MTPFWKVVRGQKASGWGAKFPPPGVDIKGRLTLPEATKLRDETLTECKAGETAWVAIDRG